MPLEWFFPLGEKAYSRVGPPGGSLAMGEGSLYNTGTSMHVGPIAYDGVVLVLVLLMEYRDELIDGMFYCAVLNSFLKKTQNGIFVQ